MREELSCWPRTLAPACSKTVPVPIMSRWFIGKMHGSMPYGKLQSLCRSMREELSCWPRTLTTAGTITQAQARTISETKTTRPCTQT